ncbi:MAG: hypothetical protein ABJG41_13195 [Cyclobacteriaceae bacterium]
MIKKLLLISLLTLSNSVTHAYPCPEIIFENICNDPVDIIHHELSIKWAYNTGCQGHDQRSNGFVVQIQNIFDEVLLTDTIKGFNYTIKPENLDSMTGLSVFYVRELGDEDRYSIALKSNKFDQDIPSNLTERLNKFLLNGYFLNALNVIEQLNKQDLLPKLSEQLSLLFPANYPDNCDFFNSYLSTETGELITMPHVNGLDEFIKNLNKETKDDYIKGDPFNIELLISPNNEVLSINTEPKNVEAPIGQLVSQLSFQNSQNANSLVLIKVSKSDNGKKYVITNERALINPNTSGFRKSYPYKGAIH